MDDKKNVGGRDRLTRFGLTVVLSILAVRWLRAGKRLRGLLAGVGALGFGFNATTGYCGVSESAAAAEVVTNDASGEAETHSLTCAACGEPISPGQRRGPNEQGDTVHDDCE